MSNPRFVKTPDAVPHLTIISHSDNTTPEWQTIFEDILEAIQVATPVVISFITPSTSQIITVHPTNTTPVTPPVVPVTPVVPPVATPVPPVAVPFSVIPTPQVSEKPNS